MTFGKLRNWCDYQSLLLVDINGGLPVLRALVNLQYDWLVLMSLGGTVGSFYHVTS